MAQQLKSPSCSCIVQFGSQHSHVGLQPPVTSVPGDLISSSDLWILGTHSTHTCMQAKHQTHKIKPLKKKPDVEAHISNPIAAHRPPAYSILYSISTKRDVALTWWKRRANS